MVVGPDRLDAVRQVGGVDDAVESVDGESADRQVCPRHPRAPDGGHGIEPDRHRVAGLVRDRRPVREVPGLHRAVDDVVEEESLDGLRGPRQAAEGGLEGGVGGGEERQLGVATEVICDARPLDEAHQPVQPEAPEAALKAALIVVVVVVVILGSGLNGGGGGRSRRVALCAESPLLRLACFSPICVIVAVGRRRVLPRPEVPAPGRVDVFCLRRLVDQHGRALDDQGLPRAGGRGVCGGRDDGEL